MVSNSIRANIRKTMSSMTIAEAAKFAASFDDETSRRYAEEFVHEISNTLLSATHFALAFYSTM